MRSSAKVMAEPTIIAAPNAIHIALTAASDAPTAASRAPAKVE